MRTRAGVYGPRLISHLTRQADLKYLGIVALVEGMFFLVVSTCQAANIVLPPTFVTEDLLFDRCISRPRSSIRLETGACVGAFNNVQSLWTVSNRKVSPRLLDTDAPYARLRFGEWACVSSGDWIVAIGSGFRDVYDGNRDAGQLWLDLRSKSRTQSDYAPSANDLHVATRWYGIGRRFGFRARHAECAGLVFIRSVTAGDLLARSMDGSVSGDDFMGNVRILSTRHGAGTRGSGWALDGRMSIMDGRGWEVLVAAEGLAGEMKWSRVTVRDEYVLSPRVFTDPDGFYRDTGGISGVSRKREVRLDVGRTVRLDVMRKGKRVDVLGGCMWEQNYDAVPNLGAALRSGKWWTPYFRVYPTEARCEIGAAARGWLLSISGDDWIFAAPRNATISLSVVAEK